MTIVLAVLAFGALIAFHDLGHMWVAQRMGMRVERYSIGFGPALFTWRRNGVEYVLGALPLGGYVKIAGMAEEEDEADTSDEGSYLNKPAWKRLLVIGAGPAANYLLAFLIGVPLLMSARPEPDPAPRVGGFTETSAGNAAGLEEGDLIVSVAGKPVTTFDEIPPAVSAAVGDRDTAPVALEIDRAGQRLSFEVTPQREGAHLLLGLRRAEVVKPGMGFLAAIPQAAQNLYLQSKETVLVIKRMITREQAVALSGPIGIVAHTADMAEKGLSAFLMTVWGLSIAVGFFNLLPLPGLDGGRLVFLGYEMVARRKVNRRVEGWIHTVGILALLLLIVFVSYGDIVRRFKS